MPPPTQSRTLLEVVHAPPGAVYQQIQAVRVRGEQRPQPVVYQELVGAVQPVRVCMCVCVCLCVCVCMLGLQTYVRVCIPYVSAVWVYICAWVYVCAWDCAAVHRDGTGVGPEG